MQWEHRVLTTDPPEKSQELMIVLKLVYSFLIVLGLRCCLGFSLAVVCGLLIAVDTPVVEVWLWGVQASVVVAARLQSTVLVVAAQGLGCSTAHGTLLDQGLSLCLLH